MRGGICGHDAVRRDDWIEVWRCRIALAEISSSHPSARHCLVDNGSLPIFAPFLGPEEESLVLIRVVVMRNEKRPSNREAEVISLQWRLWGGLSRGQNFAILEP